ncbi:MAG: class I SAM-dependent methyltransferase [Nitrospirota bacterium]|nr:class I SAM-dependent methyltransferase [Nitrospirota bacterium]
MKSGSDSHWDGISSRWWQWRELMGSASRPVSERMVELARIGPGSRVLDVASGYGEPAATAARRVGELGLVIATDLSAEMVRLAARRAGETDHHRMRVARMDGAAPAFRPASFDAVLCRWGLMALSDQLETTLHGLARLLAPGGMLVVAVWGAPERVPSIAIPLGAARRAVGQPPPVAGERGPFRLADGVRLPWALRAAGLTHITTEVAPVRYRFASAAAFSDFCRATSSPLTALLAELPQARHAEVWDAVEAAARELAAPDGSVSLENAAVVLCGRARPAAINGGHGPRR